MHLQPVTPVHIGKKGLITLMLSAMPCQYFTFLPGDVMHDRLMPGASHSKLQENSCVCTWPSRLQAQGQLPLGYSHQDSEALH